MSICRECLSSKDNRINCQDNPIHANYPHKSCYQAYIPTCPRGYTDCICDPAYIKHYHPEWYKKLYGDKTPEEAAEKCRKKAKEDPNEEYWCYDDEDK